MDMYGMEQVDEMQQENEPSIEDIKKLLMVKDLKTKNHEHHLKPIQKKTELKIYN